ncbi:MAG TPA: GNAT family protein [Dehalococcoidia bacterium]|nr:GNAT family protein [Dehalococcoidia bacterium]
MTTNALPALATRYRTPVTLEGQTVRLVPLALEHAGPLWDVLRDHVDEVWAYLQSVDQPTSADDYRDLIQDALDLQATGMELPFAVIEIAGDTPIGTTRFLDMSVQHRHAEIGWTWYAPPYWRTSVNTQCKYLLLRHAFEELECIRVQLRTDERTARSRAAIERIGGKLEGIIRKDRVYKSGWQRSSAQYSLLAEEWPARKAWFEEQLRR